MKILSAIEDDVAIHKILSHLNLLPDKNIQGHVYTKSCSPPPVIMAHWEKEECGYFADLIPDVDVYCRDV